MVSARPLKHVKKQKKHPSTHIHIDKERKRQYGMKRATVSNSLAQDVLKSHSREITPGKDLIQYSICPQMAVATWWWRRTAVMVVVVMFSLTPHPTLAWAGTKGRGSALATGKVNIKAIG